MARIVMSSDGATRPTGISRPVDELGRIVLPIELRRAFDIREGDRLEIYTSGSQIVLEKSTVRCAVCGIDKGDLHRIGDCHICRACAERIVERIGGAGRYAATP